LETHLEKMDFFLEAHECPCPIFLDNAHLLMHGTWPLGFQLFQHKLLAFHLHARCHNHWL
jgi:hypothetical protein